MREKYKDGRIWGGTAEGSVGHKPTPRGWRVQDNLKLPPLNCKPVFQDVASNTTMSNFDMPAASELVKNDGQQIATTGNAYRAFGIGKINKIIPAD